MKILECKAFGALIIIFVSYRRNCDISSLTEHCVSRNKCNYIEASHFPLLRPCCCIVVLVVVVVVVVSAPFFDLACCHVVLTLFWLVKQRNSAISVLVEDC